MEYKKYPTHISHNNPLSKDYVESERDEYKQNVLVDEYNATIRALKNDLPKFGPFLNLCIFINYFSFFKTKVFMRICFRNLNKWLI